MARCYGSRCGARGSDYPLNRLFVFAWGTHDALGGFSDPMLLAQGNENLPGTPLYAGWEEGRTRKPDEPLFSIAVLSSPQIREEPFVLG